MGNLSKEFWNGRRVLLTGHTGFKGSWLALWLQRLGSTTAGFALKPHTTPSLFDAAQVQKTLALDVRADVRDQTQLLNIMTEFRPDIVIHMAAQALVRESFHNPTETWSTNLMGTVAVLEGVRKTPSVSHLAVVTTDKCYWNDGSHAAFRESDPLGGKDPYSASKAATEMAVISHFHAFLQSELPRLAVLTLRAGNIVGGGDWSADRLVPDIVRSVMESKPLWIRMPGAVRPWQYVLDALKGYLLAIELAKPGLDHFNFAPPAHIQIQVNEILIAAQKKFPRLKWNVPAAKESREAAHLTLDAARAERLLNWRLKFGPEALVARTLDWYERYYQKQDARQLCMAEIEAFL